MPIQPQLEELEAEILEVERKYEAKELSRATRDQRLSEIKSRKTDLQSNASKLISLEHKVLVFLDTPNMELLEALMPLLSHDAYESKYKFTDKKSSGKLESTDNVLWGWATVIFAQTIDISHRRRFSELARRFIIVNPNTSQEKVNDAVDLAILSAGLPDIAYQREIVTDRDVRRAKSIVRES